MKLLNPMSLAVLTFIVGSSVFASGEVKGLEWLDKYKDANGCIPLKQLLDNSQKNKECPAKVEPQIRPLTIGSLNVGKTAAARKNGKELCCFDWNTFGNR